MNARDIIKKLHRQQPPPVRAEDIYVSAFENVAYLFLIGRRDKPIPIAIAHVSQRGFVLDEKSTYGALPTRFLPMGTYRTQRALCEAMAIAIQRYESERGESL